MADVNAIAQDPSFLSAQPEDQIKYLSSIDTDFAAASPQDKIGYLNHIHSLNTKNSAVSQALATIPKPTNPILSAGEEPGLETGPLATQAPKSKLGALVGSLAGPAGTMLGYDPAVRQQAARNLHDFTTTLTGMVPAIYHSVVDKPQDATEEAVANAPSSNLPAPIRLALYRNAKPAVDAAQDYVAGRVSPDAALSVAGQALSAAGANVVGGAALDVIPSVIKNAITPKPVLADVTAGQYSPQGNAIAASLRSSARVDMPAEATAAHEAIAEGLADAGFSTQDLQGRNGPLAFKRGLDNAIRIQELRAKQVIDPIRNESVLPEDLADKPELTKLLGDKPTYGAVDAQRVALNKKLRSYYRMDPTAQAAVAPQIEDLETAVNQARDLVYGKAQETTGFDIRPWKKTESSLLKLVDPANATSNALSAGEARYQATPGITRAGQKLKAVIATAKSPVSSLSAYEQVGKSPLTEFSRNMQAAFPDLKPTRANTNVALPKYNLGNGMPLYPDRGPSPILTPSGSLPPDVQRVLPFENPGESSSAYPGAPGPDRPPLPFNPSVLTPEAPPSVVQNATGTKAPVVPEAAVTPEGDAYKAFPKDYPKAESFKGTSTGANYSVAESAALKWKNGMPLEAYTIPEREALKAMNTARVRAQEADAFTRPTNPFDATPGSMDALEYDEAMPKRRTSDAGGKPRSEGAWSPEERELVGAGGKKKK